MHSHEPCELGDLLIKLVQYRKYKSYAVIKSLVKGHEIRNWRFIIVHDKHVISNAKSKTILLKQMIDLWYTNHERIVRLPEVVTNVLLSLSDWTRMAHLIFPTYLWIKLATQQNLPVALKSWWVVFQ